jgi:hypothetical protein
MPWYNDDNFLEMPAPPNLVPVVSRTAERPPPYSKFVRELSLDLGIAYVDNPERPFLVSYYIIESNLMFRVPPCSISSGAPDLVANNFMDAMGYGIQIVV